MRKKPPAAPIRSKRPVDSLFDEPASRATAWLTLSYLNRASRAASNLKSQNDPKALHDFRVALRRLRTCLRTYRKDLRKATPRGIHRRLKRLAHSTNSTRDAEVFLAWLNPRLVGAANETSPTLRRLALKLRSRARRGRRRTVTRILPAFSNLADALAKKLRDAALARKYPTSRRMGEALQRHFSRYSARLRSHLTQIHSIADFGPIHKTRISAKRLRYLIEPFQDEIHGGRDAVQNSKRVQDLLGELHDAQGLMSYIARSCEETADPQIKALKKDLRGQELDLFDRFRNDWLRKTWPQGLKPPLKFDR